MYRTHTCGELRLANENNTVTLAGWIQKIRNLGGMTFIDLRDRYGITQLVINQETQGELSDQARKLGREFVIQVKGVVIERSSKNPALSTGEIEIQTTDILVINKSEVPPFTIEDESDGGEELRMKYRYLDLRRNPLRKALELRHRMAQEIRRFFDDKQFIEVETPVLIKSTPEGARDFVVPSRMWPGEFYALPQSPQLFKQLLMVSGYDRYFQIVKCFRDEDLRADRQPEFTQIDCEMAFVDRDDILELFEGLVTHLFKKVKNIDLPGSLERLTYADAMSNYGSDKPDLRFDMKIVDITSLTRNSEFKVFEESAFIGGICAQGCSEYTRKQLDELTEWVKRPQIGAKGLVYVKYGADGSLKSSVDKFYNQEVLQSWAKAFDAKPGDLILLICGNQNKTLGQLGTLRLEMGEKLGLRDKNTYKALWVVDFPLLEWDEETQRYYAMHHPFTAPIKEDLALMDTNPGKVRANAYDLVINGVEIGGGSIRIFDSALQQKMFDCLGFTKEEAELKFGFLLSAFKYGAPPHGGIAFGFDRWCAMFAGTDSIRDVIAFPKNNAGKDMMIDTPSPVTNDQLKDLGIKLS